jgi:lipopolysaccharide/colanic/teichoic acid biosynthesis glycosyltransferase
MSATRPVSATLAVQTARRRPPVLGAPIFRSVVMRERKRADRSGRTMLLALVTAPPRDHEPWPDVIERLGAVTDATDLIGWYDSRAVLGVVRTTMDTESRPSAGAALESGRAFGTCVRQAVGGRCTVRVLVHPEPATEDLRLVDRALYPELLFRRRADRLRDVAKRALDIGASALSLVILAPAIALIAGAVKATSSGPAFFAQTRIGHLAAPFTVRKFRTMHVNADPTVHREFVERFIGGNGAGNGSGASFFKLTEDPRITRVGRFLRKTSLDELPQLWNVLRGDMSLVGPRPPVPYEYARYQPWHRRRVVDAKPGLTGLWQVTGRSRTTFDEMVRLDLRYAQTRSLRIDLVIIGKTPTAVISGRGAC